MANFIQKLFGGGNSSIASSSGSGGGILVPSSSELSKLDPNALLKSYNQKVDPTQIEQIPDFAIPKIDKPYLPTDRETMDIELAGEKMKQGADNYVKVTKVASGMEKDSARMVDAHGKYIEAQRDAEFTKQKANSRNAQHAATFGVGIQKEALDIDKQREICAYQIQQMAVTYQEQGGWS